MAEIYIDLETIPSGIMPELSDVKVPANYSKPDTILKYQLDHLLDAYKSQALDSMVGRIFCVGYAIGEFGEVSPVEVAIGDEFSILTQLETVLFTDPRFSGSKTWVGWNLPFDLTWIWRKAIKHGLDRFRKVIPKDNRQMTCDLMRIWASDFKDFIKMSDVATFLNIPHSSVGGSDVYDLWKAGNTEAIVKHCRDDVQCSIDIYRRICQ